MPSASLLIFDDGRGRFGPMTDRRATFDLRTGARTTRQRIEQALGLPAAHLRVPARLADVYGVRETQAAINTPLDDDRDVLLVNGRWLATRAVDEVRQLTLGQTLRQPDGQLVAAHLSARDAEALLTELQRSGASAAGGSSGAGGSPRVLIDRPWHILDALEAALRADLAAMSPLIAPSAKVHPSVVIDDSAGPVGIDADAQVGAFTVLEGPCYVGRESIVQPHTLLRAGAVVGPRCKVAGEIKASILHGDSNKAHTGYLGDSLVGQWCNLGADTNVSNLKNTYGPVRVQLAPDTPAENTGRTNHGPILGDFVRTAIGSRLLTGSVVGTACMLAVSSFAPKCAPAFSFLTDAGTQAHEFDRFLDTARRMLARRGLTMPAAEETLLRKLHAHACTTPV